MSKNLIETAQGFLTESVISKIASSLGLEASSVNPIIEKAIPTLLGAIGLKAKSGEGAAELFESIAGADAGFVDNLDDQLTGDNTAIIEEGQNTLAGLLGNNFTFAKTALGAIPGLSSGKIGGVIGMLTPFLTGILKKETVEQNLDAAGLASLLDDQNSYIGSALGGDFLKKSGFGALASFGSIAGGATGAVGAASSALSGAASSAGGAVSGASGATRAAGGAIGTAAGAAGGAVAGSARAVGGAASSLGSSAAGGAAAAGQKGGGGLMKILPILLIAVLAFFGIKMCGKSPDLTAGASNDGTAPDSADVTNGGSAMNGEGAGASLGGLKDGITDLGNKAANSVGDAAGSVTDGMKDAASATGDSLGGLRDGAADLGNSALDSAGNAAGAMSDGMKDAANATGDALGGLRDGAAGLGNKALDSAGNAAGAMSDGMKDAANATGDALGGLKGGAADLGNKALGSAGDAAGAMSDGMKDAANATGDALGGLKGGAADLGNKALGSAGDAAGAVSDTTTGAIKAAGGVMGDMKDKLTPQAGGAVDPMSKNNAAAPVKRSFVPDSEDGAPAVELSEKAANLAQGLSSFKVSDGGDLDSLYASFGADNDSQFLYRIPFATGQTGVPTSHEAALIAKLKSADPEATIVTIGYADVRGDDALNKRLSYGRAKEIGEWIKGTVGNDTSIESFSMGETDRFSKSDFSKNRVVEVWQIK